MSITNPRAAALASLVAAALLAGTNAQAQVFGLRFSPNRSTPPRPSAYPRHAIPNRGYDPGRPSIDPIGHRDHITETYPQQAFPGAGAFPGSGDPRFGQPGAYPVPTGHWQPDPGYLAPDHHAPGRGGACPPIGPSPAIGAVDALIGQVGDFLQVYGPTARHVPQGEQIHRDAAALYESALELRQAALAGAPPQAIRRIYEEVDRSSCRLVSRVERVARGRTGPNIEQVRLIAATSNQLRAFF